MDREPDEMRCLGVVGICKEAYNILHQHLRLFLSLAITLVLPLGVLLSLVDPLTNKIRRDENELSNAERFWLIIFVLTYFVFVLAFSLLSTAAIIYTVAGIYTAKGLSYMKVLSVVPKVWKRLFMTFLWAYVLILLYNAAFGIIITIVLLSGTEYLWYPVVIVFSCLAVYIYLVWSLASVVSVLEDSYGIAAMRKSSELIKGKRWVACSVLLIYTILTTLVLMTYNSTHMESVVGRVVSGVLHLLLWTALTLIGIVMQTVVYFVCKSYHEESIDRFTLSEHLDGFTDSKYMPLKEPASLEAYVETPLSQV